MTSTQLTDARNSLWDAIDGWEATQNWKQYRCEGDPNLLSERGPSAPTDLPAIRIMPASIKFEWQTQLYMSFDYTVDVTVWQLRLVSLEAAMQDTWEAVRKCCPPASTVPYTRSALAKPPQLIGERTELKYIGKTNKILAWSGVLTLGLITENTPNP